MTSLRRNNGTPPEVSRITARSCRRGSLVAFLLLVLGACGEAADQPVDTDAALSSEDELVDEYKAKMGRKLSESIVNSLVREWEGVTEAQVRCLLDDLEVMQLEDADTDPAVAEVFRACGVDPSVAG